MEGRSVTINITVGSIVKTILLLLLAALLWYVRDIVLIVLTAIVIASSVEPGIALLVRRGLSRILAVIALYVFVALAFFGILFFFIPPVLDDAAGFLTQLPATLSSLDVTSATHGLVPWGSVSQTLSSADFLTSVSTSLGGSGGIVSTLSTVFGGLLSFVLVIVFSFYFSVQETGVDDFLRVVTPKEHEAYVLGLWKRSQSKIGKWMQGQLILAAIVGVLIYLGLLILGVAHPLVLAILAAVFELIPVFGQFMAAIPAVVIGFSAGGLTQAVLIAGLFLIVQQFEAHLIYPVVVKKVVGVPPLLVILALLVGFKLFGFLGVLLSVPIAGAIQEVVADIDKQKTRALARQGLTPEGDPK